MCLVEMSEFTNVFIFVSDALRYGYVPQELEERADSSVIRTLAPSHHSAKSFASLLSGLSPENHGVGHFGDKLEEDHILEFFPNSDLWDHKDSSVRFMLDLVERQDINEMEEPFIWVERGLETHVPYRDQGHNKQLSEEHSDWRGGRYYFDNFENDGELRDKYNAAAQDAVDHFQRHVNYLRREDMLEDTLVIFTSDHGDILGERVFGRFRHQVIYPKYLLFSSITT